MGTALVATDADWVADEVEAALADDRTDVVRVNDGRSVLAAAQELGDELDLIVLDLQIGNMGGMAVCMQLRHEEGAERLDESPVLMLLDREPDVFLARRSGADGWLVKPLDPIRLRRAANALRAGDTFAEEPTVVTVPVLAATDD